MWHTFRTNKKYTKHFLENKKDEYISWGKKKDKKYDQKKQPKEEIIIENVMNNKTFLCQVNKNMPHIKKKIVQISIFIPHVMNN